MDKRNAVRLAKQFVKKLPEKYELKKAFLFGSYAKGTAHEDSDIDVAVIVAKCKDVFDENVKLLLLGMKIDSRIEPHIMKETDFEDGSALADEIKKHGILLR